MRGVRIGLGRGGEGERKVDLIRIGTFERGFSTLLKLLLLWLEFPKCESMSTPEYVFDVPFQVYSASAVIMIT